MGTAIRNFLEMVAGGLARWRVEWDNVNDRLTEAISGTEIIRKTTTGIDFRVGVTFSSSIVRDGRQISQPICGNAKVGATAGWVITGGTNKLHATLPASQTGSTLVVPIQGLEVGDTITGFELVGQIESAGNAVTLDCDLRKQTSGSADNTDASVGAMTQVSVTADTKLSSANAVKTGLTDVVAADEMFYLLITGTTLGSTDVDLIGAVITVTRS